MPLDEEMSKEDAHAFILPGKLRQHYAYILTMVMW